MALHVPSDEVGGVSKKGEFAHKRQKKDRVNLSVPGF